MWYNKKLWIVVTQDWIVNIIKIRFFSNENYYIVYLPFYNTIEYSFFNLLVNFLNSNYILVYFLNTLKVSL